MALTGLTQLQPNNIQVVGIATFDQSVGIAGTLTYQDVTNVDAVGIVTARSGINVSAGDLTIPSYIKHLGDTNTMIGFPSDDSFSVTTNNVTRMTFTGNFIDLPDAGTFRLGNSNDLQIYHGSGGASNIVHSNTSQPLIISATGAGSIRFDTNSNQRLSIQADGDISFSNSATGSAQIKNVNGDQADRDSGGFPQYSFVGNEGTGMRRASSNVLCFDTNGDERLRIESNGKIAIGQHTGATHDIHIKHATSPGIRLEDTTNSTKMTVFAQDSDTGVGNFSNHDLLFYTNSTEKARIQSGGYVLVGETNRRVFSSNNYPIFQVASTTSMSSSWGRMSSTAFSDSSIAGGLVMANSRGTSLGAHTVLQNNDQLGILAFEGSDGDEFIRGASIIAYVDGTPGNNDMPTQLNFNVTNDNSNSPTTRMTIRPAGYVELPNDTYLSIPHDERCIVFDEGQKMITSNDGQGNFNLITGKNNDAVHVSSASGQSGLTQIEMNSDGSDGNIWFAVGPTRAAGSSATFVNGFKLQYYASNSSSKFNGLQYVTGSSTSPSGLGGNYPFIHKGNAFDGTWTTDSTSQFKVLGDGGSIAITTNDGGGNCNVCFNHASETPDTNGSSWRITANIDGTNSSMYFSNNGNVTSGASNTSMATRLEITNNGTFVGSSSNNISDVRLKKNISTITDATTKIKGLVGRTFEWKEEAQLETGTQYGFIAQEMETVVSDLVTDGKSYGLRAFDKDGNLLDNINHDGVKEKIVEYSKGVNIDGVVPILVEALKEAITKIETLETKVAALEGS